MLTAVLLNVAARVLTPPPERETEPQGIRNGFGHRNLESEAEPETESPAARKPKAEPETENVAPSTKLKSWKTQCVVSAFFRFLRLRLDLGWVWGFEPVKNRKHKCCWYSSSTV